MSSSAKRYREQVDLQFFECTNYKQLNQYTQWHDGLIECYREVFKESWGENYTYQEVKNRLQRELTGHACLRFAVDLATQKVLAFCWAQYLSAQEIKLAINAIHYIHTVKDFSINQAVPANSHAIYIHDIGILKPARSQVPLALLIMPTLEAVALYARTRELIFWSIQQTSIAHIANKINIQPYYEKEDVQFFSGFLPAAYGV